MAQPLGTAAAYEPDFSAFSKAYGARTPQVVSTRLVADLETPVSAYIKLAHHGGPGGSSSSALTFLLESVEGGATRGRYSIIGLNPDVIWRARGDRPEVNRTPLSKPDAFVAEERGTLASLRALLAESRIDLPRGLPPMAAGVFGYMGYDVVRLIERLPNENPDVLGVPDGMLMRPTVMVIFDSVKDEMVLVSPVYPDAAVTAEQAYRRAQQRLDDVVARLDQPLRHEGFEVAPDRLVPPNATSNTSPDEYMDMVRRAKEYIAAGDAFQIVPSQRFSAPFALPPLALYRSLRRLNPSPFLFHLDLGSFAIVGSSPEILVRVREGTVTIRPLAGSRRRGATPEEDKALGEELLADPKERAEHLMLLDLGRNDVGRVASIGSVRVPQKFVLEHYSHIMHISSEVVGSLDPKYDAIDALMAGFPAGTLSGAPKVRAMEIIDELEKDKRGPYSGCVGYFSADGQMDTCIAIRTAVVKDGVMHVQTGAGIVADSVPESEQQECIDKARALFRAAEEAVRFAQTPRAQKR
jgi:anthranilate synthase component 1